MLEKILQIRNELEKEFPDFPSKSCKEASKILHEKLGLDQTFGIFTDYEGKAYNHYWNKKDGKIYDITADQFSEEFPKVYVLFEDSVEAKIRYKEGVCLTGETYMEDENYDPKPSRSRMINY